MGILLEKYRKKLGVIYEIVGIAADVNQLLRAYIRSDSRGIKKNISQIIKKLERVKDSL